MLSVYSEGLTLIRAKAKTEIDQIKELLNNSINDIFIFDSRIVKRSNIELRSLERKNKKTSKLLNPKRQIYRIFTPLFLSLLMIMIDKINKSSTFWIYNQKATILFLSLSFTCALIVILVIKQVAWKVIETKEILDKTDGNKEKDNLESIRSIISNNKTMLMKKKLQEKRKESI
jgi:hypothetical protein